MRVLAYDPGLSAEAIAERGAEKVDGLASLLAAADVVSLHVPLTETTRHLIGQAELALMKPTAILVNAARGGIVDEPALAEALRDGRLAGAGLDVLEIEPPSPDNPLLTAPNVVLSPHTAGNTVEAARHLALASADIVMAVLSGRKPEGFLNPEVWEGRHGELRGLARRSSRTPISPLAGEIVELGELASLAELERGSPLRLGVGVHSQWKGRSCTPLPNPPPQGAPLRGGRRVPANSHCGKPALPGGAELASRSRIVLDAPSLRPRSHGSPRRHRPPRLRPDRRRLLRRLVEAPRHRRRRGAVGVRLRHRHPVPRFPHPGDGGLCRHIGLAAVAALLRGFCAQLGGGNRRHPQLLRSRCPRRAGRRARRRLRQHHADRHPAGACRLWQPTARSRWR